MISAEEVKSKCDLLAIAGRDTALEKVAKTGGGEYAGPCPMCGGEDRFRIQLSAPPGKKPTGQRWMCRNCSPSWGDPIGYVMETRGMDFLQAIEFLAGDVGAQTSTQPAITKPEQPTIDRQRWQQTANEFIDLAYSHLRDPEGAAALDYLHGRGLSDAILDRNSIGYNPADGYGEPEEWGEASGETIWLPRGIVIPNQDEFGLHSVKIRRRTGEPKYYLLKGSQTWLFGGPTFKEAFIGLLFESELDAILASQSGLGIGYGALPAGQVLKPEYQPILETIDALIVCYDNDPPGQQAAERLVKLSDEIHLAEPLPDGAKDLTEYYQSINSLEAVYEYIWQQIGNLDRQR